MGRGAGATGVSPGTAEAEHTLNQAEAVPEREVSLMTFHRVLQALAITGAMAPLSASAQLNLPVLISCVPSASTCNAAANAAACASDATFTSGCASLCNGATPTAAQCASETWFRSFCGERELQRLEAAGKGSAVAMAPKCLSTIQNTPVKSLPKATVLLPSSQFGDTHDHASAVAGNTACGFDGGSCVVKRDLNPRPVKITGLSGDLHSAQVGEAAKLGVALVGGQTQLEKRHEAWRLDGPVTSTCEEYAFHRYQSVSLFEDATLAIENDPRAVFNVAYTPLAPASDTRAKRAIGLLGITNWNGDVLRGDDLFGGATKKKNAYLEFKLGHVPGKLTGSPTTAIAFVHDPAAVQVLPSLIDPDLSDLITLLRSIPELEHQETFAWHKAMSDAAKANGYSDEYLERMKAHRLRYEALLRDRSQFVSSITYCVPPPMTMPAEEALPGPMELIDPSWDPSLPLGQSLAEFNKVLFTLSLMDGSGGVVKHWVDSPSDVKPGQCLPVFSPTARTTLAQMDARIEDALNVALDNGCLGPWFSPCDWAPSDFRDAVRGQFIVEREAAYQECLAINATDLKGTLSAVPASTFFYDGKYTQVLSRDARGDAIPAGTPYTYVKVDCVGGNYTASPLLAQRYAECKRAHEVRMKKAVQAALGKTGTVSGDASKDGLTITQTTGGSQVGGNDLFGATVTYASGWDLSKLREDNLCTANAGVSASATVATTVLGVTANLLNASAHLGANEASYVNVRVLGIDIAGFSASTLGQNFSPITGSKSSSKTFLSASQTFMVGPFPVRVKASAAGYAGLDWNLSASCTPTTLGVQGTFRPYAGIEGKASAGVSAVVAEVGVKIDLTLAELSLPLSAALTASNPSKSDAGVVRFDTQLDLVARFLDGRAAAYAEVCYFVGCESWEYTLFSWSGLRTAVQLFNAEFEVPLDPIAADL